MSLPIVGQPPAPQTLSPAEVTARLQAAFPDGKIDVLDLTGTQDHYQVAIVSPAFQGLSLLKQHQLVYDALAKELQGAIHALTLKTSFPT
jgi:stress-induced morphogen